jgi:hypothetical protein
LGNVYAAGGGAQFIQDQIERIAPRREGYGGLIGKRETRSTQEQNRENPSL